MKPNTRRRLVAVGAATLILLASGGTAATASPTQPQRSVLPPGPIVPPGLSSPDTVTITPYVIGGDTVTNQQMRRQFPGVASFQIYNPQRQEADWHTCTATAIAPPPGRRTGTPAELTADAALQRQIDRHSATLGGRATRWAWLNAHCFTNDDATAWNPVQWDMHLRIGSTDRTSGGQVVKVTDAIPHQGWAWGSVPGAPVHDAGLLVLDRWVRAGATIAASPGREGTTKAAGWGLLQPGDDAVPTGLRQIDYTAPADPRHCTGTGLAIAANELCGQTAVTSGVCNGDSGGPLTRQTADGTWQLIGSTSRAGAGEVCGSGGDIFTDVTAYRDWIRYVMAHGHNPSAAPRRTGNLRAASSLNWPNTLANR